MKNEQAKIDVVNGYLNAMGQRPISGEFERAWVLKCIQDQLDAIAQYGHTLWDGYDVADALREQRQLVVHVVDDAITNAPVFSVGDTVRCTMLNRTGKIKEVLSYGVEVTIDYPALGTSIDWFFTLDQIERVPFRWDKV